MVKTKIIVLLTVLFLFFGCGLRVSSQAYQESPMLTERVAQGLLPAVEERLPAQPYEVGPGVLIAEEDLDWQVGRHGGQMQAVHSVANWNPDLFMMNNQPLIKGPGIGLEDLQGNIVRDYDVSADNRVFTFHMRKGLKWSDGQPVTTEDVRFAYEDVLLNTDLTPIFPAKFRSAGRAGGEPMELRVLDDYTFEIEFDDAYGGFLREISIRGWTGYTELIKPSHFLKQYHAQYTPIEDMAVELAEEELESDEWYQLFQSRDVTNWELNQDKAVDFPVLYPWVRVPGPSGTLTFERNPYYFKVDVEGNQLPYIDEIVSHEVSDMEMVTMRVVTGEVDFLREDTALSAMPMYREHEEQAGYRAILLDMHVDATALFLNLSHEDETWQLVVSNPEFRRAINMAIDRQEIIDSIYYGMAGMPESIPSEYDPEQAEAILDRMGMDQRDADGNRLAPNGEPFELFIETAALAHDIIPATELIVEHISEIGINVSMRQIGAELRSQRAAANELYATTLWSVQPMWRDGTWTDYLPDNLWGPEFNNWYHSGGETGVEPPDEIKALYEINEGRSAAIPFSDEELALVDELYELFYENVFFMNLVENVAYPMVVSADLGNIPHSGQAIAANYSGEQFFFKD